MHSIKQSARSQKRYANAKQIFQRSRLAAYAYTYVRLLNENDTFECLADAFADVTIKMPRLQRKVETELEAFKLIMARAAAARTKAEAANTDFCSRECDETVRRLCEITTPAERDAWILIRVGMFNAHEASKLLKLSPAEVTSLYESAEDKLRSLMGEGFEGYPALFNAAISRLSGERDIWTEASFRAEKKLNLGRIATIAALGVIAAAILFFVGRECVLFVRIASLPEMSESYPAAVTVSETDSSYWRLTDKTDSAVSPNLSKSMYAALNSVSSDEVLRVDFTFYDPAVMESIVTDDGKNLKDIYVEVFTDSTMAAKLDLVIITMIWQQYADYVQPWRPDDRENDFEPPYPTLYDAMQALLDRRISSGKQDYIDIVKKYPDILRAREGFEAYLTSGFSETVYWLREIVSAELAMQQYRENPEDFSDEQASQLREEYELALFRYANGNLDEYTPVGYKMTAEQYTELYTYRSDMGYKMCDIMDKYVRAQGFANLTDNTVCNKCMCSYTAEMTKSQILSLALEDGRYWFNGVSVAPVDKKYPQNIDPLLYCEITNEQKNRNGEYTVYVVNNTRYAYNKNYIVEISLPTGFIRSLYSALPTLQYSIFELDHGYVYRVMFGHEYSMSRYSILRAAMLDKDETIVSASFKYYILDDRREE